MTPVLTEHQAPAEISNAVTHQNDAQAPNVARDRYASLDVYRGFIMLMLVSHAFGLNSLRDQPGWHWLAAQFEHVEWEGLVFWDLIQPAFMFMVGMAMPFAFANRSAKGESVGQIFRHVAWRALMLIVLSQVLINVSGGKLQFQLINVLSQIAFTYFFTFLILRLPIRFQVLTAFVTLGRTLGAVRSVSGTRRCLLENRQHWCEDRSSGPRVQLQWLLRNDKLRHQHRHHAAGRLDGPVFDAEETAHDQLEGHPAEFCGLFCQRPGAVAFQSHGQAVMDLFIHSLQCWLGFPDVGSVLLRSWKSGVGESQCFRCWSSA